MYSHIVMKNTKITVKKIKIYHYNQIKNALYYNV